jgi:hypothetical protein
MRTHSSRDTGSMRAVSCQALAEGQIGGRIFDLSGDGGALVLIKSESIPKRREKMVRSSSSEDGVTTFGWSIGCQLDYCRGSSGRQAGRQGMPKWKEEVSPGSRLRETTARER